MNITITKTNVLTEIDGVPCRVWKGVTEQGIACTVLVHRIAVRRDDDNTEFEREMHEKDIPDEMLPLPRVLV